MTDCRQTLRRVALPAALCCASVLVPATAAAAAEPERSGWWNRASAGGVVAPAPTAQEGDLRVGAVRPDQPTAYAAVLFTAPGSARATLDLELRSASGTPQVVACPTVDTAWEEGGNQPYEKAPAFDCTAGTAVSSLSEDGKVLSFTLDEATQTEPGVWSLALVPEPGSTSGPFTVDVVKPGPAAFQAEAPDAPAPGATAPDASTAEPTTPSGGDGEAFLAGGFDPAPSFAEGGTAELPPLVAGGEAAAPPAASTAVAGAPPVTAAAPLLLARPAGLAEDVGAGRRLLALLVLAGGSAAVGYAAGQQRPGPRLIGGRSRLGVPAAVPAGAPDAAPAQDRPRGIGRFAKTRDAAPRRLR